MITNTVSARFVAPFKVNTEALDSYAFLNPKALLPNALSRFEKRFLLSLGWVESPEFQRFTVLGRSSAKTEKGELKGWLTGICYLQPERESGFANLCLWAKNCREICLNTAGRGAQNTVQKSRQRKTFRLFKYGVQNFLLNVVLDIRKLLETAANKGFGVAVRLDGTSDLGLVNQPIESLGNKSLPELFPSVEFYEYSKSFQRMGVFLTTEKAIKLPGNVHFTYSYDGETNATLSSSILALGGNVAVCFSGSFPETFMGSKVIDGDESDLRFLDPKASGSRGFVVGLKAKGKAKRIHNGFVVTA